MRQKYPTRHHHVQSKKCPKHHVLPFEVTQRASHSGTPSIFYIRPHLLTLKFHASFLNDDMLSRPNRCSRKAIMRGAWRGNDDKLNLVSLIESEVSVTASMSGEMDFERAACRSTTLVKRNSPESAHETLVSQPTSHLDCPHNLFFVL